jgi:hypothetical protein
VGFDSHRPLHSSLPRVSLRCPRTRLRCLPRPCQPRLKTQWEFRRARGGLSLPALAMFAVKMLSKGIEASAKEYSELVGPCRNILQRFGVQPVQSVATIAAY